MFLDLLFTIRAIGKKKIYHYKKKIIDIFHQSRDCYGTRKIKVELAQLGYTVSRRRIGRIMADNGLVSQYTLKQKPKYRGAVNNDVIDNLLKREFKAKRPLQYLTSDLTYVKVAEQWNYVCFIMDLYNREIVGYESGTQKDAKLVLQAIESIDGHLEEVEIFHTDRGSEFKNEKIDKLLYNNGIKRSLSQKGTPIDNAVSESMYKVLKTEFTYKKKFKDKEELIIQLYDYVHWYNHIRIHGSLNYQTPVKYRLSL